MGGFDRHHARRCGGDLRQSEQILVAANARIGAARALYFPSISLTGLLGTVSTQLSSLFSRASRTWIYAGAASVPLFTAGGIEGTVQQAEAQQQQALLQYQKAIQISFREVEDSLISHQKAREQLSPSRARSMHCAPAGASHGCATTRV